MLSGETGASLSRTNLQFAEAGIYAVVITSEGGRTTNTASLTEANAGLTTSGTLTVRDADLKDTVSTSIDSLVIGGTYAAKGSLDNTDVCEIHKCASVY